MKITLRPPDRRLARPVETKRFLLRPLGILDTLRITESWRSDADILTGIYFSPEPRSLLMWLRKGPIPNNVDRFAFAIVPRGATDPIGVHMVKLRKNRAASNGIGIHDRSWWGADVVVEVRAALMAHFFANGPVDTFLGFVRQRNLNSIFVYRRMGFAYTGLANTPKRNPATGEVADIMRFEMARARWDAGPFGSAANGR